MGAVGEISVQRGQCGFSSRFRGVSLSHVHRAEAVGSIWSGIADRCMRICSAEQRSVRLCMAQHMPLTRCMHVWGCPIKMRGTLILNRFVPRIQNFPGSLSSCHGNPRFKGRPPVTKS